MYKSTALWQIQIGAYARQSRAEVQSSSTSTGYFPHTSNCDGVRFEHSDVGTSIERE